MKKSINFLIMVLSITMLSCSGADCTNGIQDGTETNIDCGGDCPPCVNTPTSLEQSVSGLWYHSITIYHTGGTDTPVYPSGSNCKVDFTLNLIPDSDQYRSYGALGVCSYAGETGWWINSSTEYLNDIWIITTVTSDSLILDHSDGSQTLKYHK